MYCHHGHVVSEGSRVSGGCFSLMVQERSVYDDVLTGQQAPVIGQPQPPLHVQSSSTAIPPRGARRDILCLLILLSGLLGIPIAVFYLMRKN